MKISQIKFIFILFCAFSISLPLTADENPVKIAVMGSQSELGKEIDLLTVEFAKDDSLSVLSRSEWTKLTREYEILKQDTASAYSKFGQISGADALLILEKTKFNGKKSIVAKLVTTKTGLVIDALVLPDSFFAGEMSWVGGLTNYFRKKLAKLANQNGNLKTVSLLNISSESPTHDSLKLEKQLNALFSYRLKRNPEVLVTERRNMPEILFEKYLNQGKESEFKTGAAIIDGSFKVSGKTINLDLKIKSPTGKTNSFQLAGSKDKLAKLAENITQTVLTELHSQDIKYETWDMKKEAEEYLNEAIWAYNCGLYEISARAAEAAWGLECRDKRIFALRVFAYANIACRNSLNSWEIKTPYMPDVEKSAKYINAAITAVELYNIYLLDKFRKKRIKAQKEEATLYLPPNFIGKLTFEEKILMAATAPLRAYRVFNLVDKDADKTALLRRLIQKCLFRPDLPKATNLYKLYAYYIPCWYRDIETQQKKYLAFLEANDQNKSYYAKQAIYAYLKDSAYSSHLYSPLHEDNCFLTDWTGRKSKKEIKAATLDFFNEMARSKNPDIQFYAMATKPVVQYKALKTDVLIAAMEKFHEQIKSGKVRVPKYYLKALPEEYRDKLIMKFLGYIINKSPNTSTYNIKNLIIAHEKVLEKNPQKAEWFRKLINTNTKQARVIANTFKFYLNVMEDTPPPDSLCIKKFWTLANAGIYDNSSIRCAKKYQDEIFFSTNVNGFDTVYSFSPKTMKSKYIAAVGMKDTYYAALSAISDKYAALTSSKEIFYVNRQAKKRKELKHLFPMNITASCISGDTLLIGSSVSPRSGIHTSALISFDLITGKPTTIASSRIKPARNIFEKNPCQVKKIIQIDKDNFLLALYYDKNLSFVSYCYSVYNQKDKSFSWLFDMPMDFLKKHLLNKVINEEDRVRKTYIFILKSLNQGLVSFSVDQIDISNKEFLKDAAIIKVKDKNFYLSGIHYTSLLKNGDLLFARRYKVPGYWYPALILIGEKTTHIRLFPVTRGEEAQRLIKTWGFSDADLLPFRDKIVLEGTGMLMFTTVDEVLRKAQEIKQKKQKSPKAENKL